jgi:hypothetical protein
VAVDASESDPTSPIAAALSPLSLKFLLMCDREDRDFLDAYFHRARKQKCSLPASSFVSANMDLFRKNP